MKRCGGVLLLLGFILLVGCGTAVTPVRSSSAEDAAQMFADATLAGDKSTVEGLTGHRWSASDFATLQRLLFDDCDTGDDARAVVESGSAQAEGISFVVTGIRDRNGEKSFHVDESELLSVYDGIFVARHRSDGWMIVDPLQSR